MAILILLIDASEKVIKVPYIYYSVSLQEKQVKALLDSKSLLNAINPNFALNLDFYIRKTNVRAQKINGSIFEVFEMVIADFWVENKCGRPKIFKKIFLVANIKFQVILKMPFLKISNAKMSFD